MSVGPALESTNELLNAIRVGLLSVRGDQPPDDVHRSQRLTSQTTPNWKRVVLVSMKSSTGGQAEDKMLISVGLRSRRSKS